MSNSYLSPPPGVGIRVVESTTDQLVLSIPSGGKSGRGLGTFALLWNLITLPITTIFLLVPDDAWDGGPPPTIMLLLFFGIFWAVGIGMAVAWLKMRFTTTLLAITPGELSVQRILLGRKKMTRTLLDENSQARQEVSYQSNDVNVYRISVVGVDREERFGTRLSQPEKDWLVNTINGFLDPDSTPSSSSGQAGTYCSDCGCELLEGRDKLVCPDCGRVFQGNELSEMARSSAEPVDCEGVDVVAPHEIWPDSPIVIEVDEPDCLRISYPFQHGILKFVGCFFTVFSVFWYTVVLGVVGIAIFNLINGKANIGEVLIFGIVGVIFGLIGIVPLKGALGASRSRVMIEVNRQELLGQFRTGFIKMKRSVSIRSIHAVGLGTPDWSEDEGGRTPAQLMGQNVGMVYSSEFNMPVTMGTDVNLDRDVTGLIRYQLNRLGHHISDE